MGERYMEITKNKTTILLVVLTVIILVLSVLAVIIASGKSSTTAGTLVKDKFTGVISNETDSTKKSPYVGCLADTDGDGMPDGVIFADLLEGWAPENYSGKWNDNENGAYEITDAQKVTAEQVKSYNAVLNTEYAEIPVLEAVGEGKERFYVLSLSDFSVVIEKVDGIKTYLSFPWYDGANGIIDESNTSLEFGTGKSNTEKLISLWNDSAYGPQNQSNGERPDIWSVIQEEVQKGWFLPSLAEWAAFGDAFKITSAFNSVYGLYGSYWTSSLESKKEYNTYAWRFSTSQGVLKQDYSLPYALSIRLATIF